MKPAALAIQKVPGVGRKTFPQIESMGLTTLGDIKKIPENILLERLGKFGSRLAHRNHRTEDLKLFSSVMNLP